MGEETVHHLNRPVEVNGQRTSALRTTDLRVLALWHLLVCFRLLPCGFANRDLREPLAVLTGQSPNMITQGRMTYDLRRLRLHGMIERIPKTHRYRVTDFGLRAALYFPGFTPDCIAQESRRPSLTALPCRPAFNELSTSSKTKSIGTSATPNWLLEETCLVYINS